MLAFLTFNYLEHSLSYVVAACINTHQLYTCVDCLFGCSHQVGVFGVLTKSECICSDVSVVIGGELDVAGVAFLLGQVALVVQHVLGNHVVQVEAQGVSEATFGDVFAIVAQHFQNVFLDLERKVE